MDKSFEEQYPDIEWNDFINSNYATGYEDPTLFSSLDQFDFQAGNTHADRISTPVRVDYTNLQGSLGGQDSGVDVGETGQEYREIKALIEENSRYLDEAVQRVTESIDIGKRQIDQLGQHVAALHPYFEAMRSTLKELTEQVNRQWVVKTPITPLPKRPDALSQGGNSGKANKSEDTGGEGSGR